MWTRPAATLATSAPTPARHATPVLAALLAACTAGAHAADFSDTAISWRYGQRFREPYIAADIQKNVIALTHVSTYAYGSNYFNVDLLQSDKNDPASLTQDAGAQEAYIVYRHTLDIGAVLGRELRFGAVKGIGAVLGFDWNTKNDVGYSSRKRMLVFGPTLIWDVKVSGVPGVLNTGVFLLNESNAPSGPFPPISQVRGRYTYDVHPMLAASWSIPLPVEWAPGWGFDGYVEFIAGKGRDETGRNTGPETNFDAQLMYDIGSRFGQKPHRFRVGFEYQLWNNKFGNTAASTGNRGQRASTPMVRAEYHF
jgi:nucleoside-specific outer membrane channel protein Tsx